MILKHMALGLIFINLAMPAYADDPEVSPAELNELIKTRVGSDQLCKDLDRWATTLPRNDNNIDTKALMDQIDGHRNACALPTDNLTAEHAKTALGKNPLYANLQGETLTLFARAQSEPIICCTLPEFGWDKLDENLWGARTRLSQADKAMLQLAMFDSVQSKMSKFIHLRGPNAPEKPFFNEASDEELEGEIIYTTLESPKLGETRRISIYLPPNHKPDGTTATLVMADGSAAGHYARMIEPMIMSGTVRPLAIIGIHAGIGAIVDPVAALEEFDVRALDYLPGWDEEYAPDLIASHPNRFEKHMAFITDTVLPWMRNEYGISPRAADTGFTGQSNGAVAALYGGFLHPDVFGISIPISPGWSTKALRKVDTAPENTSLFYIAAGLYEPMFLHSAKTSATSLKSAGYNVVTSWNAAGHSPDQTEAMLYKFLPLAFPPVQSLTKP